MCIQLKLSNETLSSLLLQRERERGDVSSFHSNFLFQCSGDLLGNNTQRVLQLKCKKMRRKLKKLENILTVMAKQTIFSYLLSDKHSLTCCIHNGLYTSPFSLFFAHLLLASSTTRTFQDQAVSSNTIT